jgi:hypothetical protein
MINLDKEQHETAIDNQEYIDQVYKYAANLLVNDKMKPIEVEKALVENGIDQESAKIVLENLNLQIQKEKKEDAQKDMLYGALWCIGGTVLTIAQIGFIFWGAIVFGAYQFLKGLFNYSTAK